MERTGRRDAEFSELVVATSTQLTRSAYLLTGSRSEAEDLVQTALAKAYAAWSRVRASDDRVAYVHGILIKSFLSSRRRRSSTELVIAEVPEHLHRVHHDRDPTERIALMTALGELAPLDRAVVVLRHWQDRSIADTADALGASEAAVKNRSLRALRTLRHLLSTDPVAPSPTSRSQS